MGATDRTIRPRPLSVGETVRGTYSVYRRGLAAFLVMFGIVVIPDWGLTALLKLVPEASEGESALSAVRWAVSFLSGAIAVVAHTVAGGAAVFITSDMLLGRSVHVFDAFRRAARRCIPTFLAIALVGPVGVVAVGALAIPFLAVFGGSAWRPVVTIVFTFAVPIAAIAVYAWLGWMLPFHAILLERTGVIESLGRSRRLMQWNRRRLLICVALISYLEMVVFSVPSCALTMAVGGGVWFKTCWGSEPAPTALAVSDAFLRGILSACTAAWLPIMTTVLYYDLRVREEGFNLDLRRALEVGRAPD